MPRAATVRRSEEDAPSLVEEPPGIVIVNAAGGPLDTVPYLLPCIVTVAESDLRNGVPLDPANPAWD